jgi:hypothetical protein
MTTSSYRSKISMSATDRSMSRMNCRLMAGLLRSAGMRTPSPMVWQTSRCLVVSACEWLGSNEIRPALTGIGKNSCKASGMWDFAGLASHCLGSCLLVLRLPSASGPPSRPGRTDRRTTVEGGLDGESPSQCPSAARPCERVSTQRPSAATGPPSVFEAMSQRNVLSRLGCQRQTLESGR